MSILIFCYNFIYNIADSLPKGLYRISRDITNIKRGDIVVFPIASLDADIQSVIYKREYLPKYTKYLMKEVVGVSGDEVILESNRLLLLDKIYEISKTDKNNRELPKLSSKNNIIRENEFLVFGRTNNSFDSRYFGTIRKKQIKFIAKSINQKGNNLSFD